MQILMDENELLEIQQVAKSHRMTVAEWVRQALRVARRSSPTGSRDRKLDVVREATHHAFPVGDIGQILIEIERGYLDDPADGSGT